MSEAWELLDNIGGMRTYIGSGDEDDTVLIKREFDSASTNAILDRNKASQVDSHDKRSEMWHAASIPVSVMYEWLTKFGINAWNPAHRDGVMRLLNDPDYRYLRVRNFII